LEKIGDAAKARREDFHKILMNKYPESEICPDLLAQFYQTHKTLLNLIRSVEGDKENIWNQKRCISGGPGISFVDELKRGLQ